MTTLLSELHDALLSAGAPEDRTRKAAEAVAAYDEHVRRIDRSFAEIERRLTLLTWQLGLLSAVVVAIGGPALWLLIRVAAKTGAVG